jgi:hypothetical protein
MRLRSLFWSSCISAAIALLLESTAIDNFDPAHKRIRLLGNEGAA